MKTMAAFGFLLIGTCLSAAPEAKDIVRDKSPDGKFALRITKDDMGGSAAIIDLKGKREVATLEVYQNYTEQAHLVWSKDSRRVAYFEPDRRGGSTTVFFRNGDKFEDVALPELPECKIEAAEGETHVKTIEATIAPQKWLSSGALALRVHSGELMENGDNQSERACTQIVTIAFDSSRKASVESVKEKKSGHE